MTKTNESDPFPNPPAENELNAVCLCFNTPMLHAKHELGVTRDFHHLDGIRVNFASYTLNLGDLATSHLIHPPGLAHLSKLRSTWVHLSKT